MNLEINNLTKKYGNTTVLDNISVKINSKKSLVLIGPSGGGKTTLLKIIAGLTYPQSGEIYINEEKIIFNEKKLHQHRKKIGVVFQAFNLFPHLTALENITLPLIKVHNIKKEEAYDLSTDLLKRFHLLKHSHKKPANLSGGQQQRIAICRAVAIKPEIVLFDEPTSALDPEYTSEVLDLIVEIRNVGMEIVLITHEMGFAKEVSDHLLFIANGKIEASGNPNQLLDPVNSSERVKKFLDKVLKHY